MSKAISLKNLNSFGVSVQGRDLRFIRTATDLLSCMDEQITDFYILGGGSNILMIGDIDQLILKNEILGIEIVHEDKDQITIRVGGGENWHQLVLWSLQNGYSGIENLSLIPGTVGAAPVQNIGAYGVEFDEVFDKLEGYNLNTGQHLILNKKACQFGYRDSIFKHEWKGKFFITHVFIKLNKNFNPRLNYQALSQEFSGKDQSHITPAEVSEAVIKIRQSKLPDPIQLGNAGSFFKNAIVPIEKYKELLKTYPSLPTYPVDDHYIKIPSGWLIEQCGWKGHRIGDVSCYEKQALVLVNYGNATGQEVWEYACQIMNSVFQKFGIHINPEVNIWPKP